MFEIIRSGGWVMWPLILCSIAAMAIIGERLWSLQKKNVAPADLIPKVQQWLDRAEIDAAKLSYLNESSPLGRILAAGILNRRQERMVMKDAIEDAGRIVAAEMERYLTALGTIAAIAPFLGLLGTVIGMIEMFAGVGQGGGDPGLIARGISQELVTTASGLIVAIPSLMFYRYFRARVNSLLLDMEHVAVRLVEVLQARRGREIERA